METITTTKETDVVVIKRSDATVVRLNVSGGDLKYGRAYAVDNASVQSLRWGTVLKAGTVCTDIGEALTPAYWTDERINAVMPQKITNTRLGRCRDADADAE
jgi:hypothetical protein